MPVGSALTKHSVHLMDRHNKVKKVSNRMVSAENYSYSLGCRVDIECKSTCPGLFLLYQNHLDLRRRC